MPGGRWYIVVNDQNRTNLDYQITEFVQNSDEGEEEKIQTSGTDWQSSDEAKWIDIKADTDRLTNKETVHIIKSVLFKEHEEKDEGGELDSQFENLSIKSQCSSLQKFYEYLSFEDPFGALLNRPPSAHLTFA